MISDTKKPSTTDADALTQVDIDALTAQISDLTTQLATAQSREYRALADYQNLVRRNQEDRAKFLNLANREILTALLQPLEHLNRAAVLLNDKGVSLIVAEFKTVLGQFGLEEILTLGKPYDVLTMEVVERRGEGETVIEVLQAGYRLNGEVIVHAKVVIGTASAPQN